MALNTDEERMENDEKFKFISSISLSKQTPRKSLFLGSPHSNFSLSFFSKLSLYNIANV